MPKENLADRLKAIIESFDRLGAELRELHELAVVGAEDSEIAKAMAAKAALIGEIVLKPTLPVLVETVLAHAPEGLAATVLVSRVLGTEARTNRLHGTIGNSKPNSVRNAIARLVEAGKVEQLEDKRYRLVRDTETPVPAPTPPKEAE